MMSNSSTHRTSFQNAQVRSSNIIVTLHIDFPLIAIISEACKGAVRPMLYFYPHM